MSSSQCICYKFNFISFYFDLTGLEINLILDIFQIIGIKAYRLIKFQMASCVLFESRNGFNTYMSKMSLPTNLLLLCQWKHVCV